MSKSFNLTTDADTSLPGVHTIAIAGTVSYQEAPELQNEIRAEVMRHKPPKLMLDLAGVDKMDTAGVAVLVECLITTQRMGIDMVFSRPSNSVKQIFRLAGLDNALDRCCNCLDDVKSKLLG